jgi:hypothetical protein
MIPKTRGKKTCGPEEDIVGVGVVGIESHITEKVINVWEEVVVGELVIGVHGEEASICAATLPKNLMAHLPCMTLRGGVSEAYCPNLRCMPQGGREDLATWVTVQSSKT